MQENQPQENQPQENQAKKKNNFNNYHIYFLLVIIIFNQFIFSLQFKEVRSLTKDQADFNKEVSEAVKSVKEKQDLIEKEFVLYYDSISRMNNTCNIIEDNIGRIYHYVVPHKTDLSNKFCPECYDLRARQKKNEEVLDEKDLLK